MSKRKAITGTSSIAELDVAPPTTWDFAKSVTIHNGGGGPITVQLEFMPRAVTIKAGESRRFRAPKLPAPRCRIEVIIGGGGKSSARRKRA